MAQININGSDALTFNAVAGNVYKISYKQSTAVDIFNNTGDEICVNKTGNFSMINGVGNYFVIPSGGSYNGYRPAIQTESSVYISCASTGNISVMEKGY